jgi:hypothetical protein
MIKVLFLVMYSGEGDYDKCIESAKAQKGIDASFYIVENEPMKEAHYSIYSYWNEHCEEFDMFVKLDADCVLSSNTKVIDVWNAIQNTNIACIFVWNKDFVRNTSIPALVFGNKHCTFNLDNVVAKAQFDTGVYNIKDGWTRDNSDLGRKKLYPAALHGFYANPKHMFGQGVKRRIRGQHDVHAQVNAEFRKSPEILRFMFLIGWVLGEQILADDYNYTDIKFIKYFNRVSELVNDTTHNFKITNILDKLHD